MKKNGAINEWHGMRARVGGRFLNSGLRRLAERLVMGDARDVLDEKLLARLRGDEQVLDAGAGSGYYSLRIAGRLPLGRVHCLDSSGDMLALLIKKASRLGLAGRIVRIESDAARSGLPDSSMDASVSFGLMHELPDPEPVLDELLRVLKPGGLILVGDFSREFAHRHPGAHGGYDPDQFRALLARKGVKDLEVTRMKKWVCAWGTR